MTLDHSLKAGMVIVLMAVSFFFGEYVGQLQATNAILRQELTKSQEAVKAKIAVVNALEGKR